MKYRITLRHDKGLYTVTLFGASSITSAIAMIMKIENCPESAIVKIQVMKGKHFDN